MTAERNVKPAAEVRRIWQAAPITMDATIPSTTPVADGMVSHLPVPDPGARVIDRLWNWASDVGTGTLPTRPRDHRS